LLKEVKRIYFAGTPAIQPVFLQIKIRKEYDENGNLIYYDSSCVTQLEAF